MNIQSRRCVSHSRGAATGHPRVGTRGLGDASSEDARPTSDTADSPLAIITAPRPVHPQVFTDLLLDDSTPELRKFPFGVLAAQVPPSPNSRSFPRQSHERGAATRLRSIPFFPTLA